MTSMKAMGKGEPDHYPEALVEQMAKLAKHSDKVTILGNREIELVLALARQGFVEVTCRGTAPGPHIASDAADFVVAPAVESETELALAAVEAKRALKRGGLFLARFSGALDAFDRIVGRYGFATVAEPGGLLCCRRLAAA
jgi:hypothetical protein